MMRTIEPSSGVAFELECGNKLRVMDPSGNQVSDLFCFRREDHSEALSSGRSIDYNEMIYLTTNHLLYSTLGNPMLKILEDDSGRHDFLLPPCSLKMFQLVSGTGTYHRSCHENLSKEFAPYGFLPPLIGTTFNIFMNVEVQPEGAIIIHPPSTKPQTSILFEAKMNLIVGLTACSHEQTNAGICKRICYEVN